MIILKNHSMVDVITNSSSELFVCNANKTKEFLFNFLTPIIKKESNKTGTSGMGGEFEIYNASEYFTTKDPKRLAVYLADVLSVWNNEEKSEYLVSDAEKLIKGNNLLFIDIDWAFKETIEVIKKVFNPIKMETQ